MQIDKYSFPLVMVPDGSLVFAIMGKLGVCKEDVNSEEANW